MRLRLALLASLIVLPAPGYAQNAERTYGTSKTFLALTAWDFRPAASTITYQNNSGAAGFTISRTGGSVGLFFAPLHLPAGALVTEVEAVFCDTSATDAFTSFLIRQPRMATPTFTALVSSTDPETPGCVDRTTALGTPIQIDNNANSYFIQVSLQAPNTTIQFASMRVGYVLPISAPGPQVFNDVPPSHPFFQFIQALAAAGITGGCNVSPPLYCPEDPITRGQMAVFLSRALGLHFAP